MSGIGWKYIKAVIESQIVPLEGASSDGDVPASATRLMNAVFGLAPVNSFAVVDGARIANLKVWLDSTDLNYVPLLQGEAQEELESVAPYLVQIERTSRASLQFLTRSPALWHYWDVDGCIFIQSRCDLETVRKHPRRLTRLKRPDGSWVLFRFWSPTTIMGLRSAFETSEPHTAAFFAEVIDRLIVKVPGRDRLHIYSPAVPRQHSVSQFTLDGATASEMARYVPLTQVHDVRKAAEGRLRKHDAATYGKIMKHSETIRFSNAKAIYRMGLNDPHQAAMLLRLSMGPGQIF